MQINGFCTRPPDKRFLRSSLRPSGRKFAPHRTGLACFGNKSKVEVAQVCGVAQELGSASAGYLTQSERPTAVYTVASWSGEYGAGLKTPAVLQKTPAGGLRTTWPGTQVNTVVGVYLFMYSGEHRCWCLFVLVRACHLLWCGA